MPQSKTSLSENQLRLIAAIFVASTCQQVCIMPSPDSGIGNLISDTDLGRVHEEIRKIGDLIYSNAPTSLSEIIKIATT